MKRQEKVENKNSSEHQMLKVNIQIFQISIHIQFWPIHSFESKVMIYDQKIWHQAWFRYTMNKIAHKKQPSIRHKHSIHFGNGIISHTSNRLLNYAMRPKEDTQWWEFIMAWTKTISHEEWAKEFIWSVNGMANGTEQKRCCMVAQATTNGRFMTFKAFATWKNFRISYSVVGIFRSTNIQVNVLHIMML